MLNLNPGSMRNGSSQKRWLQPQKSNLICIISSPSSIDRLFFRHSLPLLWPAKTKQRKSAPNNRRALVFIAKRPETHLIHHGDLRGIGFDRKFDSDTADGVDILGPTVRSHYGRHLQTHTDTRRRYRSGGNSSHVKGFQGQAGPTWVKQYRE